MVNARFYVEVFVFFTPFTKFLQLLHLMRNGVHRLTDGIVKEGIKGGIWIHKLNGVVACNGVLLVIRSCSLKIVRKLVCQLMGG